MKSGELTRRDFLAATTKSLAFAATGGLSAFSSFCSNRSAKTPLDTLISNGTIYDGTLKEPFTADIGIAGDKIVAVGQLPQNAVKTIDATGLIITPGFIDVHSHCDLFFQMYAKAFGEEAAKKGYSRANNFPFQGVTTVVTGNCGTGFADSNAWFATLETMGFAVNVYHLAPHGSIRNDLFGKDQPRELSPEQQISLQKRIEEEMEKGAVGVSTGLVYAPGFHSKTEELIGIAQASRQHSGLYVTHIRNESGKLLENGKIAEIIAMEEAAEIGQAADVAVQISHLKLSSPDPSASASDILEFIIKSRAKGLVMTADQYPYAASMTGLSNILPTRFLTTEGVKEEYWSKEGRKDIQAAAEKIFEDFSPQKILLALCQDNPSYEGKRLKEVADLEGRSPAETFVEMVSTKNLPMAVYFSMREEDVREFMRHEFVYCASDGGTIPMGVMKPHPRFYGTFPKKIRKYALDEKVIDLKSAIRSMTSLPAEKFNMRGRGKIEKGYFADICAIDLESFSDKATYTNPHQYAEGVVHLWVNGVPAINNRDITAKRGGRPIRRA